MREVDELRPLVEMREHARPGGPPARLAAITAGARRRQRRAAALTSGLVAAAVAAVVVVAGGGTTHDSLRSVTPAQPNGHTTHPGTVKTHPQRPGQPAQVVAGHFTTAAPGAAPNGTGATATGSSTGSSTSSGAHPSQPQVHRTYSGNGSQTVCGGIVTDAQPPGGTKYCGEVSATPAAHGVSFDIQASLDAASRPSQFSFRTTQEIDIAVYHAGKLVWRWSSGQKFVRDAHQLALQPGSSYDWTLTWAAVGPNGHPLPRGDYDVVGSVIATELGNSNSWSTSFTI